MQNEIWYRYVDRRYSVADEDGDHCHYNVKVELEEYAVVKHTPKGAWVSYKINNYICPEKRFVLKSARKRFAHETKEAALESFLIRKNRQRSIYNARIMDINTVIRKAEAMLKKEKENAMF